MRRAVVNVPSVRQHIRMIWNRQAFSCHLKVWNVISGLRRAAGRLFHKGPTMEKFRRPIVVWALGTCCRPDEATSDADAEFGEVAVCMQFVVLPYTRVSFIWLRLVK